MDANKKWLAIPEDIRRKLRKNVFCTNCSDVVEIEQFTIEDHSNGIVLEGKCKVCGNGVSRVIED
ncbi:hypothetical protein [Falsibacillus albus]|uniref:Uncharacterized protein n=1 Tax=Falsibacillus albus TaxID=2478915 RepID=A0A3L7JUH4_9BACI|nr:hypothetical protein [Falsibacillus albus]RLQ94518.1 hypothetical protein D9X91_13315 [Falsibacillus albus]